MISEFAPFRSLELNRRVVVIHQSLIPTLAIGEMSDSRRRRIMQAQTSRAKPQ
jgi:hypothetical protein